jgi:hypothetical protein
MAVDNGNGDLDALYIAPCQAWSQFQTSYPRGKERTLGKEAMKHCCISSQSDYIAIIKRMN